MDRPLLLLACVACATLSSGCAVATPQPLTGGDVHRTASLGGGATVEGRSTGDACGPPPVDIAQRTTVDLDAKVLNYVNAGGRVEALSGIKQVLAGADLGCDAVIYRVCKICFSTQNGQGCAALTTNALSYCQQRASAPPPIVLTAPAAPSQSTITLVSSPASGLAPSVAPAAPLAPVVLAESPPIQRLVVSVWTDTDDKDREESVSVRVFLDQEILGTGGPWGGGEVWGDQENRNNGQPHDLTVALTRPVPLRDVDSLRLEIIKSQHGGHGGNGWNFRSTVIAETPSGRTEVWRSPKTIRLGNGRSASFSTSL